MSKARDIGDSAATINFIDDVTSNVQNQLDTVAEVAIADKGTLTKTFATNEASTIALSTTVTAGAPVVSVTKEVPQVGVTNNDWDAAASSYVLEDNAPATSLSFVGGSISEGAYNDQTIDVSSVVGGSSSDVAFRTDGLKMFVCSGGGIIYEYLLTIAFDVSTATYNNTNGDISAQTPALTGIHFSTNGEKLYAIGTTNTTIYEFDLSTAWSVVSGSLSYSSNSFDVSSKESGPTGVVLNPLGTKVYIVGYNADNVNEFSLSTAFDISTASFTSSFSIASQETGSQAIQFNTEGTLMFICGGDTDKVYAYNLSSAYDITSAVYNSANLSTSSQIAQAPMGLAFDSTGAKLVVMGNQSNIYGYTMPIKLALGTGSFASTDVGKTIGVNSGTLVLTATTGTYSEVTSISSTDTAASGEWSMNAVVYDAVTDVLEVSSASGSGYYLAGAAYDGVSFNVSTQDTNPTGVAFNTDGTKMFVVGNVGQDVNEYALSIGFDVSTASYTQNFSVSAQGTGPQDIAFNTDGTRMYILDEVSNGVNQYSLYTGFDLSTASSTGNKSVASEDTSPNGLTFNADGTKMFIVGSASDLVWAYNLGAAFVISSAQLYQGFSVGSQETYPTGIAFNADGTKMYITGASGQDVTEYTLSTGFELSTASFTQVFSVVGQETSPRGLTFNSDGSKMYIVGNTSSQSVSQYSTSPVFIPTGYQPCISSNIDSTYWTDINSLTATNVVGDGNVYYAVSNDDKTTWSVLDNTDGVRPIARVSGGTWQYNSNGTYGSETWVAAATNTEVQALRDSMGQEAGFQLAGAAYDSVSFSIAAQEATPQGIAFNTDGTKMFVVGYSSNVVNEYALSTGFNVSTASYTQNFSVTSQEAQVRDITFNADGTKMFIVGAGGDEVNEYALSTGFDVSTASYTQNFDVSGQDTAPRGLAFNTDGTKMFVVGGIGQDVNEYTLTTGFDTSTASYSQNFSVSSQETAPEAVAFNDDGTNMFIVGTANDTVYQYTLTTGFDLSTASYASVSFLVSSQENSPEGMVFSADGSKMFIVGRTGDSVYQYSTSGIVAIASNQMNSTTLNAITDANQITLGNDLDFAAILYIGSGSTVPTYSGTAMNYDANVINSGAVLGTDYNWDFPATDKVRITALADNNLKVRIV